MFQFFAVSERMRTNAGCVRWQGHMYQIFAKLKRMVRQYMVFAAVHSIRKPHLCQIAAFGKYSCPHFFHRSGNVYLFDRRTLKCFCSDSRNSLRYCAWRAAISDITICRRSAVGQQQVFCHFQIWMVCIHNESRKTGTAKCAFFQIRHTFWKIQWLSLHGFQIFKRMFSNACHTARNLNILQGGTVLKCSKSDFFQVSRKYNAFQQAHILAQKGSYFPHFRGKCQLDYLISPYYLLRCFTAGNIVPHIGIAGGWIVRCGITDCFFLFAKIKDSHKTHLCLLSEQSNASVRA